MAPAKHKDNKLDAGEIEAFRPARDYIWRPWYAKLWWVAIPTYWLGMAASFKLPFLADFYHSALAGLLNVLLFPSIALMVLGVGYARRWFPPLDGAEAGGPEAIRPFYHQQLSVGGLRDPYSDPLDPKSGYRFRQRFDL